MKTLIIILCLFTIIIIPLRAQEAVVINEVINVYDGDTFRVNIDEFPPIIGENIAIRILGIDTPEIKGNCQQERQLAIKARDFTRKYLNSGSVISLTDLKRDKYFRILANVYIDGKNLGDALLMQNLAVVYLGKKKFNWCAV
ncbi:MAG: thermonuclease family protein [Woeseiaceae bacterium]|jgi:micrococcal nuclease|nr:thermonuclease family protein [Woeseiaceae bacterium]MDG1015832.1 thermonuclease family protein [Woeseiaceae bacterium]